MAGDFRFAAAYLRLLKRARLSRFEAVRGMEPESLAEAVRILNDDAPLFIHLNPAPVAEWLVRRAHEVGEGEIATASLPDDAHPCWRETRLFPGNPFFGGRTAYRLADGGDSDPDVPVWDAPPKDITYADVVLPGEITHKAPLPKPLQDPEPPEEKKGRSSEPPPTACAGY